MLSLLARSRYNPANFAHHGLKSWSLGQRHEGDVEPAGEAGEPLPVHQRLDHRGYPEPDQDPWTDVVDELAEAEAQAVRKALGCRALVLFVRERKALNFEQKIGGNK